MPLSFTQTAVQTLTCTGASVSAALNLTGSPDVVYVECGPSIGVATPPNGNPALYGDPNALASIYVSFGTSGVVASPMTSFLVTPGKPVRVPLTGSGFTYVAALAQNGSILTLMFGNE